MHYRSERNGQPRQLSSKERPKRSIFGGLKIEEEKISELKLNVFRKFYLEKKQQEVEAAKQQRKNESLQRNALQNQGIIQHKRIFRIGSPQSRLFSPPIYERSFDREETKIDQKFQTEMKQRVNLKPWNGVIGGLEGLFQGNEILKSNEREEELAFRKKQAQEQRLNYNNFKVMLKAEYPPSYSVEYSLQIQEFLKPTFNTSDSIIVPSEFTPLASFKQSPKYQNRVYRSHSQPSSSRSSPRCQSEQTSNRCFKLTPQVYPQTHTFRPQTQASHRSARSQENLKQQYLKIVTQ